MSFLSERLQQIVNALAAKTRSQAENDAYLERRLADLQRKTDAVNAIDASLQRAIMTGDIPKLTVMGADFGLWFRGKGVGGNIEQRERVTMFRYLWTDLVAKYAADGIKIVLIEEENQHNPNKPHIVITVALPAESI
jgi:hypothetical protein